MVDFLKRAKQAVTETVSIAGAEIEVRGRNVRDLQAIVTKRGKDNEAILIDLICSCCFYKNGANGGKPLVPNERRDEVGELNPAHFKSLTDAVARANGFAGGNSNAT